MRGGRIRLSFEPDHVSGRRALAHKSRFGNVQAEGIAGDSFLKRALHRAGGAFGLLAVGALPFCSCSPPPHALKRMIFEEQRIAGHVGGSAASRDTSAGWGAALAYPSAPAPGNSVIPDSTTYLQEATGYVPFRRSDTSATFLIAENQVLVTFRDEASDKSIMDINDWLIGEGATKTGQIGGLKLVQYSLPPGTDLNKTLAYLQGQPGILTALPNFLVAQARNPDPNPAGTVYDGYWWMDRIRLREAWDVTTGSPDIPVAVVDVGVALGLGHFDGKVIRLGLRCKKPDGKIYFIDQINSTNECEAHLSGEHGTAVAAVLAARGDDGRGGAGLAWENPLISVNLIGRDGKLEVAYLNAGIECAIEMGARVVTASYAAIHQDEDGNDIPGPVTLEETTNFRAGVLKAMIKAREKNVLVVFAAGNTGFKNDDEWLPPDYSASDAGYFKSNALIVGATDDWDDPMCAIDWTTSFWGPIPDPPCLAIRVLGRCSCTWCDNVSISLPRTVEGKVVEISAPGYRISIPVMTKDDGSMFIPKEGGTSIAAPMVAGAAALVFSQHPDYTAEQVKHILLNSARPGGCRQIGHGLLDVAAAVGVAETWNKTYDEYGGFKSVRQGRGGFILAGAAGALVSINAGGKVVWSHKCKIEGSSTYNGFDAIGLQDGGAVLAGCYGPDASQRGGRLIKNAFVFKVDSEGKELWKKTLGSINSDGYAFSVQETNSGDLLVAAQIDARLDLIKLGGRLGQVIWHKTLDFECQPAAAIQAAADGYFISVNRRNADATSGLVLKTDAEGTVLWRKALDQPIRSAFSRPGENGVVVATSNSIVSLSQYGAVNWSVNCGESDDAIRGVVQTKDDEIVAVGEKSQPGSPFADLWVAKLKPDGTVLWKKTFNEEGWAAYATCVQETVGGGIIVSGVLREIITETVNDKTFALRGYRYKSILIKLSKDGEIDGGK